MPQPSFFLEDVHVAQVQTIASVMQANAEHAVRYAQEHFKWDLDYSAPSLERVDKIIDVLHVDLPKSFIAKALKRSAIDEEVWTMAKMWGGYVGETLRRQWGGRWKTTPSDEGGHADIVLDLPLGRCRPIEHVRRRLSEGTGDGVFAMYTSLLTQDRGG
jgi:hypothetical protein